jgi:5-(carboxyamino)imidazole ribonucleotide synthase
MGYDGKGQRVFRTVEDKPAGAYDALGRVPLILESFVPFEREVSIIAARAEDGTVACYDPAENVHRKGILHTSTLPARISDSTAETARESAEKLLAALDYVGVIGMEFFVMADGTLIANEIAPRVHNSGHWTEAACVVSQFEQHIRAVAGLPLGNPARHSDCVMTNLIGDDILDVARLALPRRGSGSSLWQDGIPTGPENGPCDRIEGPENVVTRLTCRLARVICTPN